MAGSLVLGFDTSAAHCAAAVLSGDRIVAEAAETMDRGQAERLLPILEEVLACAGAGWADLDAIGVGVGPGNFTGIRIAVATARGLALGLGVPAIGVTGFEARAPDLAAAPVWVAIDAPRGMTYLQRRGGGAAAAPELRAASDLDGLDAPVVRLTDLSPAGLATAIARAAAAGKGQAHPRPAPLYLRPADAAPMRDAPPPLLP